MFWFVWICGWGLTAAIIALVWIHSRSGRSLSVGVCLGVIAGVLWPITVWVAVGAWLYTREARRAGQAHVDPAVLASQIQQAQAYAQQAEIEGMSSSAEYWRAEAERLTAQQQASKTSISHPAATSLIVVGCTVASLITIGALWFFVPVSEVAKMRGLSPSREATLAGAPPSQGVRVSPTPTTHPAATEQAEQARTALGNISRRYGEPAIVITEEGNVIAEFVVGEPTAPTCNKYAKDPSNGRFIQLPITLKTYDDPTEDLTMLSFRSTWEYVTVDGRSLEASTSAAASCIYEAPGTLRPNRIYEFAVVLDIPHTPGAIALNTTFDSGGWEWSYAS